MRKNIILHLAIQGATSVWIMIVLGLWTETSSSSTTHVKSVYRKSHGAAINVEYHHVGPGLLSATGLKPGKRAAQEGQGEVNKSGESWSDYLNTLFDPAFDPDTANNVSAVVGQMAHLPCRVNNLGTKTVSWIRHHDTHILTVGSFTYTGDQRFSALHREGTNEWTLQIKNPTLNDSGLYECQVSTKPVRSYLVMLNVVIPSSRILHAPELHTNEGGMLNLTCIVTPSPGPPEYIFWYHEQEVINYETDRRVMVDLRQVDDRTVSTLVVSPASLNHSGIYTCEPSNTRSSEITVHIFKAEEPAAMQTSSGRPLLQFSLLILSPVSLFYHCYSLSSNKINMIFILLYLSFSHFIQWNFNSSVLS